MSEQAAPAPIGEEFGEVKQRSLRIDALERLVRNKAAMIGLVISAVIIFVAIFGPWLAPYDYLKQDLSRVHEPPSGDHWLGTDLLGRDMLSRMIHGARTAVFVALVVLTISNVLGITLGAVAAYVRGKVDDGIMRLADIFFSFPDLLLVAFIASSVRDPVVKYAQNIQDVTGWSFLDQTVFIDYLIVFGALAASNWPGTARMIRGQILSIREMDFIRAERALGVPSWIIIRKHLIPNSIAPVVVGISAGVGSVMLLESSLSFLGLGIQPPGASWGNMIADNLDLWRIYPHLVAVPGITLAIAVFGFNFLGDGINDAMNPRLIKR